jgi:DNA-binding response OmpR family regulator
VRAQLRRRIPRDEVLRVGDVALDPKRRAVTRGERPVDLTAREYELLELFLRHPGEVLSKASILDGLWGYAFDANLVEVYVGYLRRKLGNPQLIETLRGAGYILREPVA